jgi:hypothetical protein
MEYEYRAEIITDSHLLNDPGKLNNFFGQGWEFVDSICQHVSASSGRYFGAVIVILRRKKV